MQTSVKVCDFDYDTKTLKKKWGYGFKGTYMYSMHVLYLILFTCRAQKVPNSYGFTGHQKYCCSVLH